MEYWCIKSSAAEWLHGNLPPQIGWDPNNQRVPTILSTVLNVSALHHRHRLKSLHLAVLATDFKLGIKQPAKYDLYAHRHVLLACATSNACYTCSAWRIVH